jgi:hypothetical protein
MSTIFSIPLPTKDEPFLTQSTALEGRSYKITYNWNSRSDRWSFSIATEDGDRILDGAVLQVGVDILRTIPSTLDYVPPGELYLVGQDDPTLTTIDSVSLVYITSV